jgi:hypothetical protein
MGQSSSGKTIYQIFPTLKILILFSQGAYCQIFQNFSDPFNGTTFFSFFWYADLPNIRSIQNPNSFFHRERMLKKHPNRFPGSIKCNNLQPLFPLSRLFNFLTITFLISYVFFFSILFLSNNYKLQFFPSVSNKQRWRAPIPAYWNTLFFLVGKHIFPFFSCYAKLSVHAF